MSREQLAMQVNARRVKQGREPLQVAHIMRVIRIVFGCAPPPPGKLFQRKAMSMLDLPIPYRLTEKGMGR